jgi:hypothetical protein
MSVSSSNFSVGFRHIDIFALNSNSEPAGTSDSSGVPYEGIHYEAARALNVTYPKTRQIIQPGDDSVEAVQTLPAIAEVLTAELQVGLANFDAISAVSGVKVISRGTSKFVSMATDQMGFEPYFGILAYNQASGRPGGAESWNWYMMPYTRVISTMPSFADTPQSITMHLMPQIVNQQMWGEALTLATNGNTTHQALWGVSLGRPRIAAWVADGATAAFTFNTSYPAYDAASVVCYVDGVLNSGATKTTTSVTPSGMPTAGQRVLAFYEY